MITTPTPARLATAWTAMFAIAALLMGCDQPTPATGAGTAAHLAPAQATPAAVVLASDYVWQLPEGVDLPRIPANNPMTQAGFELGRHLFYDPRMSANGNIACASCHHQDKGFSDGLPHPFGTYGDAHPRNAQALGNTAWYASLNWGNPVTVQLERQIRIPMFGDTPFEHGLEEHNQARVLATLVSDPTYQKLLVAAYPGPQPDWNYVNHIVPALATFVRGLTSFDSPWDHYLQGDTQALSVAAQRGLALFSSDRLHCSQCHEANHFLTDSHVSQRQAAQHSGFHNNASVASFDFPNTGKFEATGKPEDLGLFRTPSLRNIALTAPYMHDGSLPDLRAVIRTYAAAGKTTQNRDPLITGFTLSAGEETDLLAFLCSLTDEQFVSDPRYANPWPDANGQLRPETPTPQPAKPGVPVQCL